MVGPGKVNTRGNRKAGIPRLFAFCRRWRRMDETLQESPESFVTLVMN
jgi:hypothetical protein